MSAIDNETYIKIKDEYFDYFRNIYAVTCIHNATTQNTIIMRINYTSCSLVILAVFLTTMSWSQTDSQR